MADTSHSRDAAHFLPEKIPENMTWEQVLSVYHISDETLTKNVKEGLRVIRFSERGKRMILRKDIDDFLIQKAIARAASGQTTILITHRLSQIRWADLVVVLRGGKRCVRCANLRLLMSHRAK